MPIPHFQHLKNRSDSERRHDRKIVLIVLPSLLVIGMVLWLILGFRGHRQPPSIFDTPVDDVSGYLASADFNALSTQERLAYIQGILNRFGSMNQSDSAVASAFFAGLTAKASEQLMNNARTLGKDILVEGAAGYLAMKTDEKKGAYIDQWLVKWVQFSDQMGGRNDNRGGRSDSDILDRLSRQAKGDVQRIGEINPIMAQQAMDFWTRDVASVASPKEQGQIFVFLPAIRDHLIHRGK